MFDKPTRSLCSSLTGPLPHCILIITAWNQIGWTKRMKKLVVGILAHVDAGKTTLSEALLYRGGVLRRLGRVDHKDAFLDTEALERERGITIFSSMLTVPRPCADYSLTLAFRVS